MNIVIVYLCQKCCGFLEIYNGFIEFLKIRNKEN